MMRNILPRFEINGLRIVEKEVDDTKSCVCAGVRMLCVASVCLPNYGIYLNRKWNPLIRKNILQ